MVESEAVVGGGTLPTEMLRSVAVALDVPAPDDTARRLRCGEPPVVGRVLDGVLLLDVRTVQPESDPALIRAVRAALA